MAALLSILSAILVLAEPRSGRGRNRREVTPTTPAVENKWRFYRGVYNSDTLPPSYFKMTCNISFEEQLLTVASHWTHTGGYLKVEDIPYTINSSITNMGFQAFAIGSEELGLSLLSAYRDDYGADFIRRGELNTVFFYFPSSDELVYGHAAANITLKPHVCDKPDEKYPCLDE